MKSRFELQTPAYQLLLSGYDKMIRAIGYKQRGIMYQDAIKEFLHYMENKGILNIKKVETVDMIGYYEYLTTRPNQRKEGVLSTSTISRHLFSINLFSDYLLQNNIIKKVIMMPRLSRGDEKQRNILSIEEIQTLYKTCENKRDVAILSLAYGAGLRRTELENLNVQDVQLNVGILIIRNGKNEKRREIPLSNTIISDLKDYLLNERHIYFKDKETVRTEAFLVNNKGKKMQGDHINERLKELIQKTNDTTLISKDITLHCLRHSITVHLLDNGANIEFVRDFLGHREIDTTHIYARRRKAKQQLQNKLMHH